MKKLLIIIGIMAMLLFAGCSSGTNSKNNGFALDSFNGGDTAVTLEFAEQSPPDKIRDQGLQPFNVRILLENVGEYDIPENQGYVAFAGIDTEAFGITQTSKPIPALRGFKKQGSNIIPGGKQQVIFDNLKYINSAGADVSLSLSMNICYPYETKALAKMCINGDTTPAIDESIEICELEGQKEFANSGAPIKIENMQQYPYGEHSIQFQFDIVHKATSNTANVYEKDSIDNQCNIAGASASSSDALFKKDMITYTVESGIPGLNCEGTNTGTNTIQLANNRYTVTCIQDTTGQSEYEKPITITMQYDYWERITKTINVEHIDR